MSRQAKANALLYRDDAYGALAVLRDANAPGIVTIDHGFESRDFDAALALLERYALGAPVELGDGVKWTLKTHEEQGIAALANALCARGYTDDALGSRSILRVSEDEARRPDLPAPGKLPLAEGIEMGLRAIVDEALIAMGSPGAKAAVAALPRPNARGLPWLRARALFSETLSPEAAQGKLRAGFGRAQAWVRRATVLRVKPGWLLAEFALAIPAEAIEEWEEAILPAFRPAQAGYREVGFRVEGEPSLEEAVALGAVLAKPRRAGRALRVCVPSALPGDHLTDSAFSERLGWLAARLNGELVGVGPFREGALRETGPWELYVPETPEEMRRWKQANEEITRAVAAAAERLQRTAPMGRTEKFIDALWNEIVYPVLSKWGDLGATDTEPRDVTYRALEAAAER